MDRIVHGPAEVAHRNEYLASLDDETAMELLALLVRMAPVRVWDDACALLICNRRPRRSGSAL